MVPQALLHALGRAGDVLVTLDFETFYDKDYSLSKMTTESYVRDVRFQVIGVGVKWGKEKTVWLEEWDFRAWARRQNWSRIACLAHHAHFDGLILAHRYDVRPAFWLDTLSMARARYGFNVGGSLAKLAERLGVGQKGTEVENAKGKRRADFSPAALRRYGAYCCNDVELALKCYRAMREDFPPEELWLIDSTVRFFTEPILVGDQSILRETLAAERARKKRLVCAVAGLEAERNGVEIELGDALEAARATLASSDKLAALLRSMGVEPPTKQGTNGQIYAFAKSDPGMQELLEHQDDDVRLLAEARLAVKSTIIETRAERFLGMAERGAMCIYLRYAGAHTYRWAGGDGSNMQNLNRGGALRRSLTAPPGYVLAVADSGQIEARVVAWCAGETRLLDVFRRNDEKTAQYQAAFGGLVSRLKREPTADDLKRIGKVLAAEGIEEGDFYSDIGYQFFGRKLSKKETPVERQTSKSMVLGLGFGMGWRAFAVGLAKGFLGAPPVVFSFKEADQYRVDVDRFDAAPFMQSRCGELAWQELQKSGLSIGAGPWLVHCAVTKYFVDLYRRTYSRIAGLWGALGDALPLMAEDGPEGEVRGKVGPVEIVRHGLRKPNGMILRYPGLRRGESGYSYLGGFGGERKYLYGGKIAENVVQSLARDIMAEQLLWVRAAGHRVVLCAHDEIGACVPEADGPRALEEMLAIMRRPPLWCPDLPLNASGSCARNYGDAK